ncbi:AI-2E family transporter [Cupriavidus sp. IDO]|uniref:AI-2E family transporter n=1 Tax=Cupriavidus sp. IDO TaxID=1539142 RepID=UPI0005791DA6|nr:AI-2E family transporter [Cupriavidus sp. IDO]KWR90572.1 permease [Cupriavidus sp. IDO]
MSAIPDPGAVTLAPPEATACPAAPDASAQAEPAVVAPPDPMRRANLALTVLATLFSLYALHIARDFIVPVVLAIVIAYLLDPLVSGLQRFNVPRVLGATLVILILLTGLLTCAYLLQGQVESIVNSLPAMASKLSRSVGALLSGDDSMWQKIHRATTILGGTGQAPPARGSQVVVERPVDHFNNLVLAGSVSLLVIAGQIVVVLFLLYFLLLSGDTFKRKFVKMAGTTITEKKISIHMLDEINRTIRRYMAVLMGTNAILGLCTWLLLRWLQVDNAGSWAVAAAALHLVPYFGAMLIAMCLGMVAFMQFGTLDMAAAAAGGSMLIATLIGSVVTTWMSGRMARMNAVAIFVAMLLFTWLWGAWGMLLAIPLITIAKVVADHVEGLEIVAEYLGD